MTTAGFVSGARDDTSPTGCSRVAAASSLLLGVVLAGGLPAVADAAFYVGVLAAASAAVALVAGYVLWTRASLVVRAVAALAAGGTLVLALFQVLQGLPGARELGRLTFLETALAFGLASAVLVFLVADALRRRPEETPDHPYAL
jgi:hypothetical protein